jgi:ribosome-binding protein aMBF1 (putative translation factor)
MNNSSIPWSEVKNRLLKNPETIEAFEELEPEYEIISEIIKARIEQNISQEELARRMGTKQGNISRLEGGTYNPSLRFLKKVAEGLGKKLHVSFR